MPETTPHSPEVPQAPLPEVLEATAEQKGLINHAKSWLRRIRDSLPGSARAEQQVDALVADLVDEANRGDIPSSELPLVDVAGAEEIAETTGYAPHTAEAMAASTDERLGVTLDTVAAVEGLETAEVVAQTVAEARRDTFEVNEDDANWKVTAEFKKAYGQFSDQELIDRYRSGDAYVVSLVEKTSKRAIIASLPDNVYVHSRALTVLESVHGSALGWQKSDEYTNVPVTAEYANNPWLPSLYFMRSWNNYQSELQDWKDSPETQTQFDHAERIAQLESDFRAAIANALEIKGRDDPAVGLVRMFLNGDRQSWHTIDEKSGVKAPDNRYQQSALQYLENICALGRDGVQKINLATGVVNFDRYTFGQLSLAQRFAERDPHTIQRLNEQGASLLISGQSGDHNGFMSAIRHSSTMSTIPFEVDSNRTTNWVLDSFYGLGLNNVNHVTLLGHGSPGEFWMTGNTVLTSRTTSGSNMSSRVQVHPIRGNSVMQRLIYAIRPDEAGFRNLSLISCNGASRPEEGILSVAEEIATIDQSVRVVATDGITSIDRRLANMDGTLPAVVEPRTEESNNRLRVLQRKKHRYTPRPLTVVSSRPLDGRPGRRRGSQTPQLSAKQANDNDRYGDRVRVGY